jgi:hypothetical protein
VEILLSIGLIFGSADFFCLNCDFDLIFLINLIKISQNNFDFKMPACAGMTETPCAVTVIPAKAGI